eukprot:537953-Alexandrium_andersonii.AAC.1
MPVTPSIGSLRTGGAVAMRRKSRRQQRRSMMQQRTRPRPWEERERSGLALPVVLQKSGRRRAVA